MASVFLYLFFVGFGLTVISAVLGVMHVGDGGHAHGHFGHGHGGGHEFGHGGHDFGHGNHSGHGGHAHGGAESAVDAVSPVNFQSVVAFCMGFGGVGYLATRFGVTALVLTSALALIGGVGSAWLLFKWLRFLVKGERPLGPTEYVGTVGRVTASIRPEGTGELLYTHHGTRTVLAARSLDGIAIGRDTEVVIMRMEKGIAYVQPLDGWVRAAEPGNRDR